MYYEIEVSIPFKRESVSKANPYLISLAGYKFQFPSNGKAYPKAVYPRKWDKLPDLVFQFPSNGKAYPKTGSRDKVKLVSLRIVSIPFKRESVSKGCEAAR